MLKTIIYLCKMAIEYSLSGISRLIFLRYICPDVP